MLQGASRMRMHRIVAIIVRHLYEIRRNANHVTNMIYWPIMNIMVWGFFTIYLRRDAMRPGLVSCLLGAVILWGLFNGFQRDMAVGFLDELWSRNLVNLFASPLSVPEYVTGLVAVNAIKVMIGVAFEAVIAWMFYHFNIFPMLPQFVPFILNLALFALAIGVAVTGLIFRYTTKFQTLAWSFAGVLMPLSCVFYPLDALPGFLRPIAWLLPTTHSFEGMRQIITRGEFSIAHFNWGLALNFCYFGLAMIFFSAMFESAKQRGLLVKME
ncbi:MAG TPA: ABC transporter permease [Candidatus Binataceae bacterium]|nr:ABC transporter permease [Candidatus Binataceae bacterium]